MTRMSNSTGSSSSRLLRLFGFLLLLSAVSSDDTCDAEQGNCPASAEEELPSSSPSSSVERACGDSNNLYGNGGTAQAYKPGAPLSSVVCRPEIAQQTKYKAASWSLTRRTSKKGTAPRLEVALNVWSCSSSSKKELCSCSPLSTLAPSTSNNASSSSLVEIWQTLPDGQYSSLRASNANANANNDCRAQVPLSDDGVARFTTVAPGSKGLMGGLGPGGWEWNPYGPPAIHLLLRVAGHAPLLVDLPALVHPKTLEQKRFSMSEWSGFAWVRQQPLVPPLGITSWEPHVEENRISMEVNVYVQQKQSSKDEEDTTTVDFCPSWMYGLPSSFFLEPIAVCAPSMLDFLSL